MTREIKIEILNDANALEVVGDNGDWYPELVVYLDEDGNCTINGTEDHTAHNGTPFDIWHKRVLRWTSERCSGSGVVDCAGLEELAVKIKPLIERVHAGHSVEWDGSDMVGRLTDDATEAGCEIERIVRDTEWLSEDWSVWDVGDWIGDAPEITTETTDEQIAAFAANFTEIAHHDNVILQGDVGAYLETLRDNLRTDV